MPLAIGFICGGGAVFQAAGLFPPDAIWACVVAPAARIAAALPASCALSLPPALLRGGSVRLMPREEALRAVLAEAVPLEQE